MPDDPSDLGSKFAHIGAKSNEHGGVWVYDPVNNEIVIKHRDLPGTTTELFQRVRQITPGTSENPTCMEVTAKLENQQNNVQQYIGFAERYPSFYFDSIFFLDHHGTPRFITHCDGESEVTEFPDLDMTEWRTYAVEWTNEPRVSLYIDDKVYAQHTDHVPTVSLLRFAEIINEKNDGPDKSVALRLNADSLFDEWI
jgi:hypothetical protein